MKTELVAEKGKVLSRAFQLEDGQRVVLGRGEDVDVQILDAGLSRRHCSITRQGEHFVIRDLNSRNGTYINGVRVKEAILNPGDKVQLGGLVFEFRVGPDRRRRPANLITAIPEDSRGEICARIEPGESALMELPPEFQNLENYRRIQRDLSMIYRIGNLINAERAPQQLYQRVVESILEATGADRCVLLVESADRQRLEVAATQARPGRKQPDGPCFSHTIVEEAYRNQVCVLRSDALSDERFSRADSVILQDIRSVMGVPVESPERCLGAIYVDTVGRHEAFRRHDLELLAAIGKQAGIAIQAAQLLDRVRQLLRGTVRALVATIEAKDRYTRGHSERVTRLAVHLARAMNLPREDLDILDLSGYLHDIGKIGVSEVILNKSGSLSAEEWEVIRRHPIVGAEIIANLGDTEAIARVIRHHHERWDGKGYPDGLAGEDIPRLARILAVADAFDAMTSERPYRSARSAREAIEELRRGAGTQFEPAVVTAFLAALTSESGSNDVPPAS